MRRSHLTVFPMGRDQVMVEAKCPKCKDIHTFVASFKGLEAWENGELIQRALPTLTVEQREMLMTGYCQKCWDEIFPADDDDGYFECADCGEPGEMTGHMECRYPKDRP